MSESSKIDEVKEYIDRNKYNFISEIKESGPTGDEYFFIVSSDHIAEKAEPPKFTSYHQMNSLKYQLRNKFGITLRWIVEEGNQSQILKNAVKKIIEKYSWNVGQVSISPIRLKPVLINFEEIDDSNFSKKLLISELKKVLNFLDIKEIKVNYESVKEKIPSNPIIILVIKIFAPIKLEEISQKLINKGYSGATVEKLKPKIETLRKYGLIIWSKGDIYSLSVKALNSFSYVNPKQSPDVQRALELGKRYSNS